MDEERRYNDDEVAQILDRATDDSRALVSRSTPTGLTLGELQEIGAEAGIARERIADAARALVQHRPEPSSEKIMGIPHTVSHVVAIERSLNDDEWERLVVDLRETFEAAGTVESQGSLRSWTNGELHVHVEPADEGYRVRMGTSKRDVVGNLWAGALSLLAGVGMFALVAGTNAPEAVPLGAAVLVGGIGVGAMGWTRFAAPRWAALRRAQMQGLAERIPRLLKKGEG